MTLLYCEFRTQAATDSTGLTRYLHRAKVDVGNRGKRRAGAHFKQIIASSPKVERFAMIREEGDIHGLGVHRMPHGESGGTTVLQAMRRRACAAVRRLRIR
jgi:hypothetical protein